MGATVIWGHPGRRGKGRSPKKTRKELIRLFNQELITNLEETENGITVELQGDNTRENLTALCHRYGYLLGKATGFTKLKLKEGETYFFRGLEVKKEDKAIFVGLNSDSKAHQILVEKIVAFAQKAKKIQAKEQLRPDNEKFTFRTWLIRLGWKGRETTKERQKLYKNLAGNTAFCTETSKAKWEANHKKTRG